jgi:putative transposase
VRGCEGLDGEQVGRPDLRTGGWPERPPTLVRSRSELVAEDARLGQQLTLLARTVKRPRFSRADRPVLVLLASRVWAWRQARLIVQPETLPRWRRAGFRVVCRLQSAARHRPPGIAPDTITPIERMAREKPLWSTERIRGELLKLGIRVSKRTVQRQRRCVRPLRPVGQSWATFLRTHGREIWACAFPQVAALLFRPVFAFFTVELRSRRVVHAGVTRPDRRLGHPAPPRGAARAYRQRRLQWCLDPPDRRVRAHPCQRARATAEWRTRTF